MIFLLHFIFASLIYNPQQIRLQAQNEGASLELGLKFPSHEPIVLFEGFSQKGSFYLDESRILVIAGRNLNLTGLKPAMSYGLNGLKSQILYSPAENLFYDLSLEVYFSADASRKDRQELLERLKINFSVIAGKTLESFRIRARSWREYLDLETRLIQQSIVSSVYPGTPLFYLGEGKLLLAPFGLELKDLVKRKEILKKGPILTQVQLPFDLGIGTLQNSYYSSLLLHTNPNFPLVSEIQSQLAHRADVLITQEYPQHGLVQVIVTTIEGMHAIKRLGLEFEVLREFQASEFSSCRAIF